MMFKYLFVKVFGHPSFYLRVYGLFSFFYCHCHFEDTLRICCRSYLLSLSLCPSHLRGIHIPPTCLLMPSTLGPELFFNTVHEKRVYTHTRTNRDTHSHNWDRCCENPWVPWLLLKSIHLRETSVTYSLQTSQRQEAVKRRTPSPRFTSTFCPGKFLFVFNPMETITICIRQLSVRVFCYQHSPSQAIYCNNVLSHTIPSQSLKSFPLMCTWDVFSHVQAQCEATIWKLM